MNRERLNRQMIKSGVRAALSGNVWKAFAACLIPTIPVLILQLILGPRISDEMSGWLIFGQLASFAIALLVSNPMNVSLAGYFLHLNRTPDKMPSPFFVCGCFDAGYGRIVKGMLLQSLYVLAWSIVPLAITLFMAFSSTVAASAPLLVSIFIFISGVIMENRQIAVSMVPYILFDQPEYTGRQALRESLRITKGRIWELFVMELSFFGWMFLVGVTFGIAAVYVFPYLNGTMAAYYLRFHEPAEPEQTDAA